LTGEPEELIPEEDASFDEGTIEVDPSTEAELKAMGIEIPEHDPTATEESEAITEEAGTEEAAAEETEQLQPPTEEAAFHQPEYIEIDGQLHKVEDVLKSRAEANGKIREQGHSVQELAQLKGAFEALKQHPDGQRVLIDVATGRIPQPKGPEIPMEDAEQFSQWLGSNLPRNLGQFVQAETKPMAEYIQRLEQGLNTVYAYLEGLGIEKKYGDLEPLNPYLERVNQALGQNAQYRSQEEKILMAEGMRSRETADETAAQQQTEQQKTETETRHRENVLGATVESANNATNVAPKIVDTSKMSAKELEKHLVSQGVKVVHHD
jgi:hypothetical protein